jgi:hypothetical protein
LAVDSRDSDSGGGAFSADAIPRSMRGLENADATVNCQLTTDN